MLFICVCKFIHSNSSLIVAELFFHAFEFCLKLNASVVIIVIVFQLIHGPFIVVIFSIS